MKTLEKIVIAVMGWLILIPAVFLITEGSFLYAVLGIIYFVVVVFSGSDKDRRFWKVWWLINYYTAKSLFPLPKEYDV